VARLIEFLLLFVGVPIAVWFARRDFEAVLVPCLVGCCALRLIALLRDPSFDRRQLGWRASARLVLRPALLVLAVGTPVFVCLLLTL